PPQEYAGFALGARGGAWVDARGHTSPPVGPSSRVSMVTMSWGRRTTRVPANTSPVVVSIASGPVVPGCGPPHARYEPNTRLDGDQGAVMGPVPALGGTPRAGLPSPPPRPRAPPAPRPSARRSPPASRRPADRHTLG